MFERTHGDFEYRQVKGTPEIKHEGDQNIPVIPQELLKKSVRFGAKTFFFTPPLIFLPNISIYSNLYIVFPNNGINIENAEYFYDCWDWYDIFMA